MKKQIAVLMAAATAVTTVAPALAHADVNTNEASASEMVSIAKEKLAEKYKANDENGVVLPNGSAVSKAFLNSRYAVLIKHVDGNNDAFDKAAEKAGFKKVNESAYNGFAGLALAVSDENDVTKLVGNKNEDWYVVDDASKLSNVLESSETEKVKMVVVDKGIKDGKSYRTTENKHYVIGDVENKDEQVSLNDLANELYEKAVGDTFVKKLKVTYRTPVVNKEGEKEYTSVEEDIVSDSKQKTEKKKDDNVTKVELTLSGVDTPLVFNVGDDAIDLDEAQDKDGGKVELETTNTQSTLDNVAKFGFQENEGDVKSVRVDVRNGDTEEYTLVKVTQEVIKLDSIYTKKDGYTQEGADFVNGLIKAKKAPFTFNFNGVTYKLENKADTDIVAGKIDTTKDGYKLNVDVKVENANDTAVKKTLRFEITGKSQKDLADVKSAIEGKTEVVAGHFSRLVGSNRYSTAVAVSQEQFNPGEASTIVIVGGYAQMDGLSASPLASAKNAPILLADPNHGLNNETLNEIDRVAVTKNKDLKNKTVYIVGGENSVPKSVEKQLADKFGAVVVRVSGSDRYNTSLEVAKRLSYDNDVKDADNTAYIVGGEGAADAMSISSVAARKDNGKVSPIIVVQKNGISRNTRNTIKDDLHVTNAYLVGGLSSISTQVADDLGYAGISKTRLSGSDRYATNVEVIKEFFTGKENDGDKVMPEGLVVASGENKFLVDAQTSGAFAANNNYPILLSGNKLTSDQQDMFKDDGVFKATKNYDKDHERANELIGNVYQVGGVVSSDVMSYVVDKLGL